MATTVNKPILSLMLAVTDTPAAVEWYKNALGAEVLWSLGSVAGMEMEGASFFLHEPVESRFANPGELGITTVRVELFVDNPDEVIGRAIDAGAAGDKIVHEYSRPWGTHRQGGFTDPFGHVWHVGDRSPLQHLS